MEKIRRTETGEIKAGNVMKKKKNVMMKTRRERQR
jgi:hypothetical protein